MSLFFIAVIVLCGTINTVTSHILTLVHLTSQQGKHPNRLGNNPQESTGDGKKVEDKVRNVRWRGLTMHKRGSNIFRILCSNVNSLTSVGSKWKGGKKE